MSSKRKDKISHLLHSIRRRALFHDVNIVCRGGEAVPAHLSQLAAWSPELEEMCQAASKARDASSSASAIIRMPRFELVHVTIFVRFLYTAELSLVGIADDEVQEGGFLLAALLALARISGVSDLEQECMTRLMLTMSEKTTCSMLRYIWERTGDDGIGSYLQDVRDMCHDYVAKHFYLVAKGRGFGELSAADLAEVLMRDEVDIDREEDVFDVVREWYVSAGRKLRPRGGGEKTVLQDLGSTCTDADLDLLASQLRFDQLSCAFLLERVERSGLLAHSVVLREKLYEAYRRIALEGESQLPLASPTSLHKSRRKAMLSAKRDSSFNTGTVNGRGHFLSHNRAQRNATIVSEMTLEWVLQDSRALPLFRQWLARRNSAALLHFWIDVEAFQNLSWKPAGVLGIHQTSRSSDARMAESVTGRPPLRRRRSWTGRVGAALVKRASALFRRSDFASQVSDDDDAPQRNNNNSSAPSSEQSTYTLYSNAVFIYQEYIADGSPLQLVLPAEIVRPVEEMMETGLGPTSDTFHAAQRHVFDRMNREFFRRFVNEKTPALKKIRREVNASYAPALATANALTRRRFRPPSNLGERFSALRRQSAFRASESL